MGIRGVFRPTFLIAMASLAIASVTLYVEGGIPLAEVPQLVLLRRRVTVTSDGIAVSADSLLFRLSGAEDIIRWGKAGSPLDL